MKDVRLLYASTVAEGFDPADLDDILATARARNSRDGITGLLFFTTDIFVQCLEGSRQAVNALYVDLMHDPRHHRLVLLSYGEIDERMFSSWQMAYIAPGDIAEDILATHSIGPGFRPETMTESMADAMLILLAGHLKRTGGRS